MPRRLLILCAFVLLFAVGVLLAVRFWGPFGADNFPPVRSMTTCRTTPLP